MREIMSAQDVDHALTRVASQILEKHKSMENTIVIGLRTRGEFVGKRLVEKLRQLTGVEVPFGVMDTTLYRDDLSMADSAPILKGSMATFDFNGKKVIVADDVLYTARTMRSALYCIMDQGRPSLVEVFVLIDRGHNELPLYAEYIGMKVPTFRDERVKVCLQEMDGEDRVYILQRNNGE